MREVFHLPDDLTEEPNCLNSECPSAEASQKIQPSIGATSDLQDVEDDIFTNKNESESVDGDIDDEIDSSLKGKKKKIDSSARTAWAVLIRWLKDGIFRGWDSWHRSSLKKKKGDYFGEANPVNLTFLQKATKE
ncbi:hypothetical protein V6N12_054178 [Hibiscus sabdariffa]|uniref:Uncharacterized protein n=1 Tax=Hibiscus sabdariffa TaxID=183260 RepID=A0ABR2B7K4_9ROSI